MKLKFLRGASGHGLAYFAGDEATIADKVLAQQLISEKTAVEITVERDDKQADNRKKAIAPHTRKEKR